MEDNPSFREDHRSPHALPHCGTCFVSVKRLRIGQDAKLRLKTLLIGCDVQAVGFTRYVGRHARYHCVNIVADLASLQYRVYSGVRGQDVTGENDVIAKVDNVTRLGVSNRQG